MYDIRGKIHTLTYAGQCVGAQLTDLIRTRIVSKRRL